MSDSLRPHVSWSGCRLEKNFDMRHNERKIKFMREGDAVRIAGQPAQERTDLEQASLVYFYSQGTSNGIGVLWVIC